MTATFFTDAGPGAGAFDSFRDSSTQVIDYESMFLQGQANIRNVAYASDQSEATIMMGLRFIKLDEDFAFTSFDFTGEVGQYLIGTGNNLIGLQVGTDYQVELGPSTVIGALANGGVLVNFAHQNSQLINSDTGNGADLPINTGDLDEMQVATVIDFGIFGRMALGDHLELRAEYDVMLLNGLALATEQFDHTISLTRALRVDTRGRLILHGASFGAAIRW